MKTSKPPHPDDPDDMGDFWRALREEGQQRRARNRERSPEVLTKAGIRFESKNDGAHLIVQGKAEVIDFWPGTGKWIPRGSTQYHIGVFKLIARIKK